ncbi:MAG: hypothetical protein NXI29_28540 [bacterium]|jgi:hypothetical protein|nr:hypothetical protein [bacterium]
MPDYATLCVDVHCLNCGRVLTDQIDFQWGKVPAYYRIGDPVDWFFINQKLVPPFVMVKGYRQWNCGDSSIEHVIALDTNLYSLDWNSEHVCQYCEARYVTIAAEIKGGKIVSVNACTKNEIKKWFGTSHVEADIIVISDEGKFIPQTDLYNQTIKYIENIS